MPVYADGRRPLDNQPELMDRPGNYSDNSPSSLLGLINSW